MGRSPHRPPPHGAKTVEADLMMGLLDWGAGSVWTLACDAPERVLGIAGLSVPYLPAAPVSPLQSMRQRIGEQFYMVRFQRGCPPEGAGTRCFETLVSGFCDHEPLSGTRGRRHRPG
jgi:hypothetical protein